MSKRRRQGLAPSLFPFLAVLICTLGTLILLLALVAQNATDAATSEQATAQAERVSETDEKPPTKLSAAAVQTMIEEEKFRVEQLVAFRDEQTSELGRRKDQLTHLEDHIRRLREKLKEISQQMEIATGAKKVDEVTVEELIRLRDKIEQESEAVEQLKEAKEDATPRVVIVPHKGPNGTDRRPIYLECDATGLTIWPEGTRITLAELEDSSSSANPLDAALRVIRHHAMRYYGDAGPPYPLLVVRPDGIETYSVARRAMMDWDDQFGYELIPAGVKLAFNQPDPQLRQRIYLAVRDAILKQQARNAIAARAGYGSGYLGNRPSGDLGNGTSASRQRYPTLSAKSMDQAGRASGFRDHRDHHISQSRYADSAYGRASAYRGSGEVTGADAARKLDEHLRTAVDELTSGGSKSLTGSSSGTSGAPGPFPSTGDGSSGTGYADLGEPTQVTGDLKSNSFADMPHDQAARDQTERGNLAGTTGLGDLETNNTLHQGYGDPAMNADTALSGEAAFGGNASDSGTEPKTDDVGYTMPSNMDLSSTAGSISTNEAADTGTASSSGQAFGQSAFGRQEFQNSSATASGNRATASGQASGSSPMTGQSGMQSPSNPSGLPQQIPPSIGATQMLDRQPVRRQGVDWALPGDVAASHGNAIVRTIRVQCFEDRFVLMPSKSGGATEFFGFLDGDITRATLDLATAVRDRIELWGAAIPGGRWQPRLDVEVMPRGDTRFHQLRTLMNGSGVEVNGRASR